MSLQPLLSGQLKSLQALRALAALSVVYYHTGHYPNFGSFGVDLFFVISGFVISWVAEGRHSVLQFFINRMTRIVPLYWVLTTILMVLAFIRPELLNSTTANWSHYFKSLFFIPYFKENGVLHPMLAVGWTLNYEMLFYLCMVLGLIFTPKYRFFSISVLILLLWLVGGFCLPAVSPLQAFLSSQLLFEFILGMAVWKYRSFFLKSGLHWSIWLTIALSVYVLMAYSETASFQHRLLTFGIPSLVILIAIIQLESAFLRLPGRIPGWIVHIGDASFATYLSHLYVIEWIRKVVSVQFPAFSFDTFLGVSFALLVSLCIGSLIYVGLDKKLVQQTRNIVRKVLFKNKEGQVEGQFSRN